MFWIWIVLCPGSWRTPGMPSSRFHLFPLARKGQGTGHSRRCFILEQHLQAAGCSTAVFDNLESEAAGDGDSPGFGDTLAILDRRISSESDLHGLAAGTTPVLIDDDGPARRIAPFLLDIIPGPRSSESNLTEPLFMDLPEKRRSPDASGDILVSFGGEDPASLTGPVLQELVHIVGEGRKISCTRPPQTDTGSIPDAVVVLETIDNLKDRLSDYALVICSYGLTLWEALAAGCAVLTVDPSPYHAMLSMNAGIPGLGHVNPARAGMPAASVRELKTLVSTPSMLNTRAEALVSEYLKTPENGTDNGSGLSGLARFLASLEAPLPRCAACRKILPPVIERFSFRSYYRCPDCGMTGMYRFRLKENEYGPAYFQQEYEAQYGRSYLADFDTIRVMGRGRLKEISRKAVVGGKLLDIGCAFGPFLAAAAEAGYKPYGSDVSEEGTAYVRNTLGFPAAAGRFPEDNPAEALGVRTFDIVSLWYVIEHFADLEAVLTALASLLDKKGILALSTPNGAGVSAWRSLRSFLEQSPVDHYTIWTPANARRILALHGFRVYHIRVTGHHPERFPGHPEPGSFRFRLYGIISRIFRLGDTFEIYAVKEKSSGQ